MKLMVSFWKMKLMVYALPRKDFIQETNGGKTHSLFKKTNKKGERVYWFFRPLFLQCCSS